MNLIFLGYQALCGDITKLLTRQTDRSHTLTIKQGEKTLSENDTAISVTSHGTQTA